MSLGSSGFYNPGVRQQVQAGPSAPHSPCGTFAGSSPPCASAWCRLLSHSTRRAPVHALGSAPGQELRNPRVRGRLSANLAWGSVSDSEDVVL